MFTSNAFSIIILCGIISFKQTHSKEEDIPLLCSEEFCDNYRTKFPCPDIDETCFGVKVNSTGKLFSSTTPCNCCETCLIHLKEGDDCSLGAPGSPVPQFFCGPRLKCKLSNVNRNAQCLPIDDTKCTQEQIEYDKAIANGSIGRFMQRAECDENGDYLNIKCIPGQLCYCIDKDGERIFGEAIHTLDIAETMNCECSRVSATLNNLIESDYSQYTLRCLDDGTFDPMHCFGNNCVCLNRTNARVKSKVYRIGGASGIELNQLPCYDRLIHKRQSYLHTCEAMEMKKIAEFMQFERDGFLILRSANEKCDPNGWFARIQLTKDEKFCANKYGEQIENFRVKRNSVFAQEMNCNCARARDLLAGAVDVELPECCLNGNYQKVVCRRGYCFCVDENGNQIEKEVVRDEINTLSCYNLGVWC